MKQLHYYPSTASMAPHILLEEIGVPFELVLVDRTRDVHKTQEYLKINPNGLMRALLEDVEPVAPPPSGVGLRVAPPPLEQRQTLDDLVSACVLAGDLEQLHVADRQISDALEVLERRDGEISEMVERVDAYLRMGPGSFTRVQIAEALDAHDELAVLDAALARLVSTRAALRDEGAYTAAPIEPEWMPAASATARAARPAKGRGKRPIPKAHDVLAARGRIEAEAFQMIKAAKRPMEIGELCNKIAGGVALVHGVVYDMGQTGKLVGASIGGKWCYSLPAKAAPAPPVEVPKSGQTPALDPHQQEERAADARRKVLEATREQPRTRFEITHAAELPMDAVDDAVATLTAAGKLRESMRRRGACAPEAQYEATA